jgi:hypothetical protein
MSLSGQERSREGMVEIAAKGFLACARSIVVHIVADCVQPGRSTSSRKRQSSDVSRSQRPDVVDDKGEHNAARPHPAAVARTKLIVATDVERAGRLLMAAACSAERRLLRCTPASRG